MAAVNEESCDDSFTTRPPDKSDLDYKAEQELMLACEDEDGAYVSGTLGCGMLGISLFGYRIQDTGIVAVFPFASAEDRHNPEKSVQDFMYRQYQGLTVQTTSCQSGLKAEDYLLHDVTWGNPPLTLKKPGPSENVRVGLFNLDHASQTELTEIVDLKEMTNVIQTLQKGFAVLRKDIHVTKHVMQSEHDTKLQAKSMELYCRINDKILDLEKQHQARITCLRNAFRQQLEDRVAKLSVHFDKNLQSKMVRERTKQSSDLASKERKFKQMQATILRNEALIQMLQAQLRQYQISQLDNDEEAEDKDGGLMERGFSADEASEQAATNQEELAEVIQKLQNTESKVSGLEEILAAKDEEVQSLSKEIHSVKEKLQQSETLVEKLKNQQSELADVAAKEKEAANKMLGHQNDEMKRLLSEQVRLAREEAMSTTRQEAEKAASQDKNKMKVMASQIAELEKQLSKFQEKIKPGPVAPALVSSKTLTDVVPALVSSKTLTDVAPALVSSKTLTDSDENMKAEIKRLQGELEKSHQTWEKKFAILQQSMHALKDESYLRQTLQRQAAQLHQAAVSYSSELPSGLPTARAPSFGVKKHLRLNRPQGQGSDYVSHSVTAPEGSGTSMFFHDENQITTDSERNMISEESELLPSPPLSRGRRDYGEGSWPSSHSHVPVLPSIQAK